jgi:outer membrane protein assembly factor BamB
MKLVIRSIAICCLLTQTSFADEDVASNWPQWRGPLGTGEAPDADPPVEWSEKKNIRWKVELPGLGHSTPVIWGDRIFLTAAIPFGEKLEPRFSGAPGAHDNLPVTQQHEFVALAVSRLDGKTIWTKSLRKDLPHEGGHNSGSLASASPVTDGKHLFAFFGSRGIYCLDLNGQLLWEKDLGRMNTKHGHGEGSSLALYGDTLVVNWDHEGQSFVVAFEKATGRERWKVARDEVTSWTTPIIVEHKGSPQVIVPGTTRMRAYDLASGKVIWECGGLSANIVATPVAADGMVFAGSSYEKRAFLAIRLEGAKGDITDTENVVWTRIHGTPYVPSPLLYGDAIYFLRHYQGILSRVSTKTGKDLGGPFRLSAIRNVYASPVAAAGRIYITDLDGVTLVLSHSDEPDLLATNKLDDSFGASAALVGKELFLRGAKYLYCIAKEN